MQNGFFFSYARKRIEKKIKEKGIYYNNIQREREKYMPILSEETKHIQSEMGDISYFFGGATFDSLLCHQKPKFCERRNMFIPLTTTTTKPMHNIYVYIYHREMSRLKISVVHFTFYHIHFVCWTVLNRNAIFIRYFFFPFLKIY